MANRDVTHSGKDKDGDITKLCNPGKSWSPRSKAGAIEDIDNDIHVYYSKVGKNRVRIHVVNDSQKGKYLRTKQDGTVKNNLDELPDC